MKCIAITVLAALLCASPAAAHGERFTLDAHDADLADVVRLLGARAGRNVVADGSLKPQRVTLRLKDVTFDEALATLTTAYGLRAHRDARVVFVGDAAAMLRRFPDDAGAARGTEAIALRNVRASEAVKSLRAGIVWVNHMQPTYVEAPWGGYKQSGVGRELGWSGILANTEEKVITVVL